MFPGKRTTKLKNITKLTYQKTGKGYLVRLTWKGQRYKATFMISDYGDWLAALDAAIEWRNKMEIQIGKPRSERFVCGQSHSNTGYVGIHRKVSGPQGCEVYEVSWVDPDGRAGKTKVSIAKHGEKRALQRAKRIRRMHEEERQAAPRGVRAKAHRWLCPVCKNRRRLPSDIDPARCTDCVALKRFPEPDAIAPSPVETDPLALLQAYAR